MRVLIIILTLTITGSSSAQTLYPFQVLYAENAKLSDGKILKSMDMVSDKETIKISEGGYLALVHDTGFPIEFKKDTILAVSTLNSALSVPETRKRKKRGVTARRFDNGMGLDFLLITNIVTANKRRLDRTGGCHDCNTDMELIYPPFTNNFVYSSEDLCLRWKPSEVNEYMLEIRSFFDKKLIDRIKTEINETQISSEKVNKYFKDEKIIELRIEDEKNGKVSNEVFISKFFSKKIDYPYPCNLTNPSAALMAGYYLETSQFGYYASEAEEYYLLATKLSSKKFYQDMLANYYTRQGQ